MSRRPAYIYPNPGSRDPVNISHPSQIPRGQDSRPLQFVPRGFTSSNPNPIPTEYGPAPTGYYTHRLGVYYPNHLYPGGPSTPPINSYAYRQDPRSSEQSPNTGQASRELEAARAELARHKQDIVKLQAALSSAGNNSKRKQQLEALLASARRGQTNSQGEIRRLQAAVNASARRAADLEAALEAAERKQRETEARLATFEQSYDNVLDAYRRAQEEIGGAENRIAELEAGLENASANASTRQGLREEMMRLQEVISQRELVLQRAQQEINQIRQRIDNLLREFQESDAERRRLAEQLGRAQEETEEERRGREAAEALVVELQRQLASLGAGRRNEATALQARITALEEGLAAGRAAAEAERRGRAVAEAQLDDLRRELATVPNRSAEAADLRQQIAELQASLAEGRAAAEAERRGRAAAEVQIAAEAERRGREAAEATIRQLEERLAAVPNRSDEAADLQRQIGDLRASLATRDAEEEGLNRQLISARTQLNEATRRGVRDPNEIARLQGEIDDLRQRLRGAVSLIPDPGYINAGSAANLRRNVAIAQRDAAALQRELDDANRRLAATTNPREVNNLKRRANYYKKRLVNAFGDIDRLKRASRTTRKSTSGPPSRPPTRRSLSGPPSAPGSSCGPGKSWKCKNPKPPTRGGGRTMKKKRYSGGSCKTWKCRPATRG